MAQQIVRKRDTGEAGNKGHFGTTSRGESAVEVPSLEAGGGDVSGTVLQPQDIDLEMDGFQTSARAYYNESDDVTIAEVEMTVRTADITGWESEDYLEADFEQKQTEEFIALHGLIYDRYPEVDVNEADEATTVSFYTELPGRRTEQQMSEEAWNDPDGSRRFANEVDPGTFGSESLTRLFRERVMGTVATEGATLYGGPDPDPVVGDEASRESFAADPKSFDQVPSDEAARYYAHTLAEDEKTGAMHRAVLRRFARSGYAGSGELQAALAASGQRSATAFEKTSLALWRRQRERETYERWAD